MSFENLGLNSEILKTVLESGYTTATPVQAQTIPELLAGHDLMVSSQTGTGKTAAFMLPALHKLTVAPVVNGRGPRVLVLTPTRELALQVTAAADKYGKHMRRLKTVSILGGMPYPLQNKLLSQPIDILVATPGRLIDHIERGRIDFSRLEMLVLDEADRMLDMGFIDDVERIVSATPASRQTLLFSATLEGTIAKLAQRLLKSPKLIQVATPQAKHENIEQRLHYVDDLAHKNRLLDHLLRDTDLKQAIVFTSTKRDADSIADDLNSQGFDAAALHGDMNQTARTRTLNRMRRGGIRILVATDVAARGLDVQGISHVINYDLPKFAEDYVHRIGRTGRAGAQGIAVSFANGRDAIAVKKIERFTGQEIPASVIAGFEPKFKPRPNGGGAKVTHKRNSSGFGGQPRSGGYRGDSRPAGGSGFNSDRAPRSAEGNFNRDRAPRAAEGSFNRDRAPRPAEGNFNRDRAPRAAEANFNRDRAPRAAEGNFNRDRAPRPAAEGNFNRDRAPRAAEGNFNRDRAPRAASGYADDRARPAAARPAASRSGFSRDAAGSSGRSSTFKPR